MSERQNYGALRVVHVPLPDKKMKRQDPYPAGWLSEERQVYVLTSCETTIGRALNNDLIVMDSLASREHVRLIFDAHGWSIYNITENNVLYVNGDVIPAGAHISIQSQDFFVLGHTMLQLIAPKNRGETPLPDADLEQCLMQFPGTPPLTSDDVGQAHQPALQANGHHTLLFSSPTAEPCLLSEKGVATPQSSDHASSSHRIRGFDLRTWIEEVLLFGTGITIEFAFPHRLRMNISWMVAGIALILLLLGAVTTIVLNNLLGIVSLVQENPLNLFSVLAIPIVTALGINLLVNFIDRYEREPWFLRLAAFLWGAVIAIPPTTFIEGYIDTMRSTILGPQAGKALNALFSALNAGITEETIKGLGLLLLFIALRDEFDNVTDGIVYGALIGAGFAMVENIIYFAGNPKAFLFLLIGRIALGWLSHSTFTVCIGMALGYIRHTRRRWHHIVIPLIGYISAISLHTAFDFINYFANALVLAAPDNANVVTFSLLASIGDYIPPFIAQMVIIYCLIKSLAHEAAIIREFLISEVSSGIVTVEEYALLQHSFARTKFERSVLRHYGVRQWLRIKTLYQTEIGLAFHKWHVDMGDMPKRGYLQPEDAYRRCIQRLHHAILLAEESAVERMSTS
jgi:RsiW-degrading membrane proteinase PrsW (M82 family)